MTRFLGYLSLTTVLLILAACTPVTIPSTPVVAEVPAEPATAGSAVIILMSHDSFNVSEAVIAEFEAAHNVEVKLLPSGDAGAALCLPEGARL